MRLFITGVTGYIGQMLMIAALKRGHQVHALIRRPDKQNINHPSLKYFEGDITDYDSVIDAIKDCDAILHCAAITQFSHPDPSIFYRVNVGGTKNLLEAACYHQVKKFVFTSSCSVIGRSYEYPVCENDPRLTAFENDYEISKYCAEELVKEYARKGLSSVILSPSRVYGPGLMTKGNAITKFIANSIRKRVSMVPSAKYVIGNYVFIDDVVNGHFLALEKGVSGEKYILGGENISYQEFFAHIKRFSGGKIKLIPIPKILLLIGAAFINLYCRITGQHTHLTPKLMHRILQNRALSCEKAIRELNYTITPFTEGVSRTILYLKSKQHV